MGQSAYRKILPQTSSSDPDQVKLICRMKLRLSKLFSQNIDYWKLPLSSNEEFLEDVRDLIQAELIADNLMGEHYKKD